MENKIQELEKQKESLKNNNCYIPIALPISIISAIIGPIILNLVTHTNVFATTLNLAFGTKNTGIYFSIIILMVSVPFTTVIDFVRFLIHKESIREEKGINSELDFLKKNIEKEKNVLENLKQEKAKNNKITELRIIKVDDLQQLRNLKNWLKLYFNIGYNEKKYYKYYRQGLLDRKLQNRYNDSEIQIAKEYLEEKNSLVLKNKNSSYPKVTK